MALETKTYRKMGRADCGNAPWWACTKTDRNMDLNEREINKGAYNVYEKQDHADHICR